MATPILAPNQDPASPFYLHPTDNTASQLVSIKFKGEGYGDWKRSMMISMSSKNKLGFVSGPQLFSLEQQSAEITQGGHTVAEFFTEIKSIWDKISAANPLPTCTCNQCTCNLTQRIVKMQQDQRLMQFLMKLGEHLATTRGSLLMMQPLPTISHAYRMLAQEEKQREIGAPAPHHESHAFGADRRRYNDNQNRGGYNSYKSQPYYKNNYQYNGVAAGSKPTTYKKPSIYFCDHCKVNGHSTERCFKLHGFPPGFTGFKSDKRVAGAAYTDEGYTDEDLMEYQQQHYTTAEKEHSQTQPGFLTAEQCTQLLSLLNKQQNDKTSAAEHQNEEGDTAGHAFMAGNTYCFLTYSKSSWLLDSGASDHMCASLNMFDTYEAILDDNEFITIPDGRKVAVHHKGTVTLNCHIQLKGVLHVPDFHYNLLSINKLCKDQSCTVSFTADKCYVQGHSMKGPQVLGSVRSGLYSVDDNKLQVNEDSSAACLKASSNNTAAAQLWHMRLGHVPYHKIKMVIDSLAAPLAHDSICQICPVAKQPRSSFPVSSIKSTKMFQMIHLDTWGPYKHKTHTGCTMFLTIVDDFTRTTWTHLLKSKSDAVSVIISFLNMVETQFSSKVLCIRSDNALELCEGDMK
ncbi:uncharacterized protein [Spinacia oleracea]|uniref:Integrase catalytic domain-containing protein n=1 Tax=Spinacia oleracea TaxID=3562 RepID=A0ABM3R965_SPIOL|nr:uncharacterized protein LOC130467616 [Spinacia oleracea]